MWRSGGAVARMGRWVMPLTLIAVIAAAAPHQVEGGFTAGLSSVSAAQSGTLAVSTTAGGSTCQSATNAAGGLDDGSTTCALPLLATSLGATSVTVTNQGSIPATAATLTSEQSCAVAAAVDTGTAATTTFVDAVAGDTGTPIGGVSPGAAGPSKYTDNPTAATFDGSTGYIQAASSSTGLQTFSIAVWFKTTATNHAILGFSDKQDTTSTTNADRMLWLDSAGHLVAGVTGTSAYELSSSATTTTNYANGVWHFAVFRDTKATTTKGTAELFVDGALVAGSASDETITSSNVAGVYSGYWHIGWALASKWSDGPASNFFSGTLADVAILGSALTTSTDTTLYSKTTQATYTTQVNSDSALNYWSLQEWQGDLGIAAGGMTYQAPGPSTFTDSPVSVALGGTNGYVETATSLTAPQTYSIAGMFETTTGNAPIFGFSSVQGSSGGGTYDRMLWVDSTGHLVFGTYGKANFEVTSSTTNAANGAWHQFVVSVQVTSTTTATIELYEDGNLVAGSANNESTTGSHSGKNYVGWWHFGYAYTSGYTDAPTGSFLSGNIADLAFYPTALSATQVANLADDTTQSVYMSDTYSLGATDIWPLQDDGSFTTTSTGTCSYVGMTVSDGTNCLYPAQVGACPATGTALATNPGTISLTLPTPTTNLTITTMDVGSRPVADAGQHVVVGWQVELDGGGYSTTVTLPNGYIQA